MKNLSARIAPLLLIALSLAGGCGDPPTSSENRLTGTLHGRVVLRDSWSREITDNSGVTVAVQGTDRQAVTGADGDWSITNLPAGTYTLTFSKSGYKDHLVFGYGFVGGGDGYTNDVYMTMTPADFQFRTLGVKELEYGLRFFGEISREDFRNLPVEIFVGTSPDVSSAPGTSLFHYSLQYFHDLHQQPHLPNLSYEYLGTLGLPSGTTLYARFYLTAPFETGYYDPRTHQIISTHISSISTDAVSFKTP